MRIKNAIWVVFSLVFFAIFANCFVLHSLAKVHADELLVSAFFSDSVGRYDAETGQFIENLDSNGLDGVLAARVGGDGLLYVASEGSNEIKRYNAQNGAFVDNFVVAGSGGLNGPSGVTWDANGDLLVSSFNSDSVLKYDGATGAFIEIAVASGSAGLNGPDNGTIFGPDGLLYVPSYFGNQIIRYDLAANTSEVLVGFIPRPRVMVFHDGDMFVTSETADAVRRYDLDGNFLGNFIQPGAATMDEPVGLAFFNDQWFVSSASADKVLQFDSNGILIDADFIPAGSGGLDGPTFLTGIAAVPEPNSAIVLAALSIAVFRRNRK
jgi:DNA-binding beta-propeller fold protein YncE